MDVAYPDRALLFWTLEAPGSPKAEFCLNRRSSAQNPESASQRRDEYINDFAKSIIDSYRNDSAKRQCSKLVIRFAELEVDPVAPLDEQEPIQSKNLALSCEVLASRAQSRHIPELVHVSLRQHQDSRVYCSRSSLLLWRECSLRHEDRDRPPPWR